MATIGGTMDPSIPRDIKGPASDGLSLRSDSLRDEEPEYKHDSFGNGQVRVDVEVEVDGMGPPPGVPHTRRPNETSNIPPSVTYPGSNYRQRHNAI